MKMKWKLNLLSWHPTDNISFPFKNRSNCLIVELLGIVTSLFLLLNALSYAENLSSWTNLIRWTLRSWSRSLPCYGSLITSIFIFLRKICLNVNTQDMTLFILFHVDIFSSNWWSMSKDTSVQFFLSSFFNSGSSDDTSKNFVLEVQVDCDSHKKEGQLNHVSVALVLFTSIPLG